MTRHWPKPTWKTKHATKARRKADRAWEREHAERNNSAIGPHERQATRNRAAGVRSRYERCPRCKKLRMKWLPANWMHAGRKPWQMYKKQLICFVCVDRLHVEGELMDDEVSLG